MSALVAVELHRALDDRHDYHRFDAMGKALAHGDALDIAAPSCKTMAFKPGASELIKPMVYV